MKTFYVGIKAVIVKDNKVLILRSNTKNGRRDMWEVPGGRIDGDESIDQALLRELHEELPNIKEVAIEGIVDAYRVHRDIEGDKSLTLIFYRVSAGFEGNPQISDEHVAIEWASEEDALRRVHESCKRAIRNAFSVMR